MENIASYIDHTLLRPDATPDMIATLCQEAEDYHFVSVCVHPIWVSSCVHFLRDTGGKVCSVIGFPFGANTTDIKAAEARQVVELGADEIDMVINIGKLLTAEYSFIGDEIRKIVETAHPALVKVIIETCYLSDAQKIKACQLAREAGAHFVKTSTGYGPHGATIDDVRLMRQTVNDDMGVKAAGGIRTYNTAVKMIAAGATRLGTSASVAIVK